MISNILNLFNFVYFSFIESEIALILLSFVIFEFILVLLFSVFRFFE